MLKPGIIGELGFFAPQHAQDRAPRSRWLYFLVLVIGSGYLLLENWDWNSATPPIRQIRKCEGGSQRTRVPSGTRNPAYLVRATHVAVASENVLCSEIGVDTLKAGGNAVDAIVSTTLCIGVANMFS